MYPVKKFKITCRYGIKGDWKCGYHCGIDLVPTEGDYNIYAPCKAYVQKTVKNHASYGNYIILKHTDGYCSRYAHLDTIAVIAGEFVSEGEIIGVMGNTGNSSGRHLHWEVHKDTVMAYPADTNPEEYIKNMSRPKTEYTASKGIHTVKIPINDFKIEIWDKPKKTSKIKNYANGGYFGGYKDKGKYFTLPVAHLVADCTYITDLNYKWLPTRGQLKGNKIYIDAVNNDKQFKDKWISSLIVENGKARIQKIKSLSECPNASYVISGVPVVKNGADVSWSKLCLAEGWEAGNCRATKHILLGLKDDGYIYLMGIETKTLNCVQSGEVYKKLKPLGFKEAIKLDGGGSTVIDYGGKNVFVTSENRQINNVIMW